MRRIKSFWPFGALRAAVLAALCLFAGAAVRADLRSAPGWYDENAVSTAPDWHYRVPITVPAGTPANSTVRLDVNFATLLGNLGISGTFDAASPRIVRPTGALATTQEFTDLIVGGASDLAGNAQGEIRFILEDAGAAPYYLYFDIIQNGTKPANPATPLNGNFERGGSGTATPPGWNTVAAVAGVDAKITPSETVNVASNPTSVDTPTTRSTDGRPRTGGFAYLLGSRTTNTGGISGDPVVTLSRTFTIPASGTPTIAVRWRPEGWDAGQFDPIRIDLVNAAGLVLAEIVGPTQGNYGTRPFAPNTGNAVATNNSSGWRQYNGFDCDLADRHRLTPAMAVTCNAEPWFTAIQPLSSWLGQTVSIRVRVSSDGADKSWYHIDDFEWAVVEGTLGAPEAFGIDILSPATGATYPPGGVIPLTVRTDAAVSAASSPMTAALFDAAGSQIAGPFQLFNDGSHGDVTAGDAIWSNDGNTLAEPAPTIPPTTPTGSGYVLRAFGRDASTSTLSAAAGGLPHYPAGGAPLTQANFWSIDDAGFSVAGARLTLTKTSEIVSDPVNDALNPKIIPGTVLRYCITLANTGPLSASAITIRDTLPVNESFVANSVLVGADCASASAAASADFTNGILTINPANLSSGTSQSFVFRVKVQ